MAADYLHGAEIEENGTGIRPYRRANQSVIGIIGTAPNADPDKFPMQIPTLIKGSKQELAGLDTVGSGEGTLVSALDIIFKYIGALVVVVRIPEVSMDNDGFLANVVGQTLDPAFGMPTGIQAFGHAKEITGYQPKLLIAPSLSHFPLYIAEGGLVDMPVAVALEEMAEDLRGVAIVEAPMMNNVGLPESSFALTSIAGSLFDSRRIMMVDSMGLDLSPGVGLGLVSSSASVAGAIALNDAENGIHTSPSNRPLKGFATTFRPIPFRFGDENCEANLLNEQNIAVIINQGGMRLWGGRVLSNNAEWQFINHVRLNDMIMESLLAAHMWAVDKNITKNYNDEVTENVNNFLRALQKDSVISGGRCWVDPDKNDAASMEAGRVYFSFDYGRYGVAEHIIFDAAINPDYTIEAVFGAAA